ncbi:MAG: TonB-dependent receptor [Thermodesulfobacteriota bacterium]
MDLPESSSSTSLEPLIVTGTSIPHTLNQSTESVTVITREDIESRHADSVSELLQQVPGLYVDQPGSRGGVSSVYIRGGDPNFTLVLIDGVKVNDPTNSRGGSFDFSTLSTDNIERIEIVRDPISSLYGSDAVSGVINIITKKGKGKPKITPEFSAGRFGQFKLFSGFSGSSGNLNYSITGSYLDDGEPVKGSKFKSPSFTSTFGLLNTDKIEINTTFRYAHVDSTSFPDDSGGPEFAVIRSTDKRKIDQFLIGLNLSHVPLEWWDYEVKLGFYNNKEDFSSPGIAPGIRDPFGIPPNKSDNDFSRYDINILNKFSAAPGVDFVLGFETEFEDGTSKGKLFGDFPLSTDFSLNRYIISPYIELNLNLAESLNIVLGSRIDFPKNFDTNYSPRAGISYKVEKTNTIFRGNYGEGFKLPSFFSLSNPIVGNPNLVPETSKSLDVGIKQTFGDGMFSTAFNIYYNKFKNLIDFDEGPPPQLVNRSEVEVKGFELILEYDPIEKLKLNGNLNYADSNIKGTSEELRNRPRWWGGLSVLFLPKSNFSFNLDALFVGRVFDSSIPTGDVELDSYAVFNAAATWVPHKRAKVFLAVDNLFNANYEQFVGFPAPGIAPRGGVKLTF